MHPSKQDLVAAHSAIQSTPLPKMPEAVLNFQAEKNAAEPDIDRIARIISTDIVLSGNVLKLVNSASYGLGTKISSIPQAVVILGLSTMKNVILSAALREAVGGDGETDFHGYFWDRANAVARTAGHLAESVVGVSEDDAYTTGLFQDAGALICEKLDRRYPQLYIHAHSSINSVLSADKKMFGTTHAAISYLLAKQWEVPDLVCSAIWHSHAIDCEILEDESLRALIAVNKISNHLVGVSLHPEIAIKQESVNALENAVSELVIDQEMMEDLSNEIPSMFKAAA